jgi:hypothetical protein
MFLAKQSLRQGDGERSTPMPSIKASSASIELRKADAMPEDSHRVKRNYEWDPEQNMFVSLDIPDDDKTDPALDASDLSKCTLDQLAMLPEWLIPLARRDELKRYKAFREREARAKLQDDTKSNARRRKEAIEALRLEYGDVTFYDPTTVIAGGKKHQIPEGTVFVSAPSEWKVGPRGGIHKQWYSPRSGRSYREYYK